ncbi:hypothetical protein TEQG_08830 [Trichophyton equinum CBS 127.97]|uniref:Uncharacterized protein n=1 Tax=Trichophyton equinum (strain ATCC MYA-4606 / CBS 127.97) TaxID=559882 RepID=F2Q4H3_TRIEC|nr:hypothetical protein TEQG_08830 [Trichophyton equinum CBS 127.97]
MMYRASMLERRGKKKVRGGSKKIPRKASGALFLFGRGGVDVEVEVDDGDEVDDEIEVDGGGDDGVDVDIEVAADVDVGVGADSDDGECDGLKASAALENWGRLDDDALMGTSWLDQTDMVAGACCAPFRLGSLIPTPAPSADKKGCRQNNRGEGRQTDLHYATPAATTTAAPLFIITLAGCWLIAKTARNHATTCGLAPVLSSI